MMTSEGIFSSCEIHNTLKIQIGGNLNPSIIRFKKNKKQKNKKKIIKKIKKKKIVRIKKKKSKRKKNNTCSTCKNYCKSVLFISCGLNINYLFSFRINRINTSHIK